MLIAHGSKDSGAFDILAATAEKVSRLLGDALVEHGFIWKASSDLERLFDAFSQKGLEDIVIMPYFLFDGVHVKKIIFEQVDYFSKLYPHMKITVTEPLGMDERLAVIAVDRITGTSGKRREEHGLQTE